MCLSTVLRESNPDEILMEYVSSFKVNGDSITLTDLIGDQKVVHGSITYADLTGAVIRIDTKD